MPLRVPMMLVALAIAATACGTDPAAKPQTDLRIVALNSWVGRSVFHLTCEPAGGDFPTPARACRTLAVSPGLLRNSKPFACMGGTSSWWDITITGRLAGEPFRRVLSTCWTPQMSLIGRLGLAPTLQRHLVPRRREAVLAGEKKRFPPGDLRPADLVTCDIRGHHLELGVPLTSDGPAGTGFGGAGVVSVSLTAALHGDGSVTAACGAKPRAAASR